MNNPQPANQPSVEELLSSIRRAIHGESAESAGLSGAAEAPVRPPVSGSMREMRVRLENTTAATRGTLDTHDDDFLEIREQMEKLDRPAPAPPPKRRSRTANGFADILSGSTRLEEALARLETAGLGAGETAHQTRDHTPDRHDHDTQAQFDDQSEVVDDYAEAPARLDDEFFADETAVPDDHLSEPPGQEQEYDVPADQAAFNAPEPPVAQYATGIETQTNETMPTLDNSLMSQSTSDAAASAFNRLADTIVSQTSTGERSIDDITRELLRPMLRSWLDENLPRIVERLVREEIERVSRWGARPDKG